jgi:O-antigen ligase
MTADRSLHLSRPYRQAAGAPPLPLSSRSLMVCSLFVVLAGNIVLTASGDDSAATSIVRGAGLACGFGFLLIALSRQADTRVERLGMWLSPFAVFLIYCMFSAAWSLQPSSTLIRSAETTATVAFAALWAHVAVRYCRSEQDMCTWIAAAVLGVVIYGLLINAVIFGGPIRIVISSDESERARFVFGYLQPLAVGEMLAIGTLAAIMSSLRPSLKCAALAVLIPLLYLTKTTGAAMLVAAITAAYVGARTAARLGANRIVILLPFMLATVGLVLSTAVALQLPPFQQIAEDERLLRLTGRTELWSAIWESGLASTWFGTGFDTARDAIHAIFGISYQVHNQYLAILVELGYVGLAIFALLLVIWLVPIVRSQSLVLACFALYILGVNLDNASMFTRTWLIFLTVFCYVFALDLVSRARVVRRAMRQTS